MYLFSRLTLAVCTVFPAYLLAQDEVVFFDWSGNTGIQEHFATTKTVIDPSGNSYVAGATLNSSGDYDILVTMYDSHGSQQWVFQHNGAGNGNDAASDMLVDGSGNVFVTGTVYTSSTDSNDAVLIKLNSSGSQVWMSVWNNSAANSNDGSLALVQDGSGNTYTAGATFTGANLTDFLVLAYDASGNLQWNKTWDNMNMHDAAHKIRLLPANQLAVSGGTQTAANNVDYATIKLDAGSGGFIGSATSGGTASNIDIISALTTDANDDLYVTGGIVNVATGMDMHTIKMDTALVEVWHADYNSSSAYRDVATDLAVGSNGMVYVCGYSETASNGTDIKVLRYAANGSQDWVVSIDGDVHGNDTAKAIILDGDYLYVTATSNNGDNDDYHTVKLDTAGNILWKMSFNGVANGNDRPSDITKSPDNSIYVAGQSEDFDGRLSHTLVRYVELSILTPTDSVADTSDVSFSANLGQVGNTNGLPVDHITFYGSSKGHNVYFADDTVFLVKSRIDTTAGANDTFHRVDVTFNNSNPPRFRAYGQREGYTNHYYSYIREGRERVPQFGRLVNHELWRGVDMATTTDPGGIRYYFIVNPSGNPSSISLNFDGQDNISVDGSGNLVIATQLGPIIWPAPEAWKDSLGFQHPVPWSPSYSISGSDVTINCGAYSPTYPLVISIGRSGTAREGNDELCWSTYVGGNDGDIAHGVTIAPNGDQYICGATESSQSSFPANGGFQSNLSGDVNAWLGKYLAGTHEPEWLTYYGEGVIYGYDVAFKPSGSIYITGFLDGGGLPFKSVPGAYNDTTANGILVKDAYIAKFDNVFGFLLWGTYFGGTGPDRGHSCTVDGNGQLIVAGYGAPSGFPLMTKSGAHNQSFQTSGNAFIARFTTTDTLEWCTAFGGSGGDHAHIVRTDAQNNIYVSGATSSENFPVVDPGGLAHYDDTLGGSVDHFVAKFSNQGALTWSTYIGGTGNEEWGERPPKRMAVREDGSLYLVGTTQSSDFPLKYENTAFNDSTYAGLDDGYMMYFLSDHTLWWSSYLSGSGGVNPLSVTVNDAGKVFVAGGTSDSTLSVQQVNGLYYQDTLMPQGKEDAFMLGLNPLRGPEWLTYFGGDELAFYVGDQIWAMATYNEELYCVGNTHSGAPGYANLPLYKPNSMAYYDSTYNGGLNGDAFITMFCTDLVSGVGELPSVTDHNYLMLYPNPTEALVTVEFSPLEVAGNLAVTDLQGRLIVQKVVRPNTNRHTIEVSDLTPGIYIVTLSPQGSERLRTGKLVVK